MATTGKLEKMLILAFETSKEAESGGQAQAKAQFEAFVNPETYTLEYKVKTAEGQGQGSSGAQAKFAYTLPEELDFEFLFDGTGAIDGQPRSGGIFDEVNHFKEMLTKYQGNSHEPYHLKLVWGNLIFKGRAINVNISYKLFHPDGQPLRAVVKCKFKGSVEEEKRAAKEGKNSPDLTHVRQVKAGDTLALLCYRIYGDSSHYLDVAAANNLSNFRNLEPGLKLIFPPIDKTPKNQ